MKFSRFLLMVALTLFLSPLFVSDVSAATSTVIVSCDVADGTIYQKSPYATYQQVWNATVGYVTPLDNITETYVGQKKQNLGGDTEWCVWRSFLFFNTTTVSSEWQIESVKLEFYVTVLNNLREYEITVQKGTAERPHNPLILTDYWQGYYTGNHGSVSSDDLAVDTWTSITLSDTSIIQSENVTEIVLRSSRDIAADAPPTFSHENIRLATAETANQPRLIITYNEGGAAGGPKEDDWVPLSIPNLPLHARRVLEGIQQMIRENEDLRAVIGIGLIMVVGGAVIKWDRKKKH